MKKSFIVGLVIAALAIGCTNPLGQSSSGSSSTQITTSASVHFSVKSPSTPSTPTLSKGARGMTVAFVTVTATRAGNADITANLTYNASTNTSSGDMTGLSLGQWTFLAKATDTTGDVLYSGQTIYTVVTGTNTIAIDLYENIGAIKVVAAWGLAGGFTDLKVTATRATFATTQETEAVPATAPSSSAYLINLAAGDWSVVAEGYDGGVCYFRSAATTVTVAENVVSTQSITMPQIKVTPVGAQPAAGKYATAQSVALSTNTSGAAIYYRLDGVDPGADLATAQGSATLYSAAIAVSQNTNIEARAYLSGVDPTDATALNYQIQAEPPTFSVATGIYSANQSVTISTTLTGATIKYTTDNSEPTATHGNDYSVPVSINGDATGQTEVITHLKAIVVKSGCAESSPTSADYTITGTCAAPTMTPAAGSYASAQTITLATTTPSASIRYTTGNGSQAEPTATTGTVYSAGFVISHDTTVKAIAYRTNWASSAVASTGYTLDLTYTTLSSATPITGALEGYNKMTLANSPYHIGANVAVDIGAILLIEPGVTIKFDGNYYFRADGTLIANGTAGSPITFTSNQATPVAGDWDSIRPMSNTSELSYCTIKYANRGIDIEIPSGKTSSVPALISNCTVDTCNYGAYFWNSNGGYPVSSNTMLQGCTIKNCITIGIVGSSYYGLSIDNCTISGNLFGVMSSWDYGNFLIQRSSITGNNIGYEQQGSGGSVIIFTTTFSGNTSEGIHLNDSSQPNSFSITNCNFSDSVAVRNSTTFAYDLSNNYWNTTDEATIQGMIYDYYDDISFGKVSYTPWLTAAVTW